jgi:hypothetical protein
MIKNDLIPKLRNDDHVVVGTKDNPCNCDRCEAAYLLEKIYDLHQPVPDMVYKFSRCQSCQVIWPCPTHVILNSRNKK